MTRKVRKCALVTSGILVNRGIGVCPATAVRNPAMVNDGARVHPNTFVHNSTLINRKYMVNGSARVGGYILYSNIRIPRCGCINSSILNSGTRVKTNSVYSGFGTNNDGIIVRTSGSCMAKLHGVNTVLNSCTSVNYNTILGPNAVVNGGAHICPLASTHNICPRGTVIGTGSGVMRVHWGRSVTGTLRIFWTYGTFLFFVPCALFLFFKRGGSRCGYQGVNEAKGVYGVGGGSGHVFLPVGWHLDLQLRLLL